jgi:signal transduction histidine kinase
MDRMTRFGDRLAAARPGGRRGRWQAPLLPLLAAALCGLFPGLSWLAVLPTAAVAVLRPGLAAKIVPYAVAAYGAYGLFFGAWLAQLTMPVVVIGEPAYRIQAMTFTQAGRVWGVPPFSGHLPTVIYGALRVGPAHDAVYVLPQAFVVLAAATWLLAVSGAPGSGAVRQALAQLRGADGKPRTVPPLLLVPVILLWEELLSRRIWFTGLWDPNAAGRLWSVVVVVGGLALAAWLPRAAAKAAAGGTAVLGLAGLVLSLRLVLPAAAGPANWFSVTCYGPLTLYGRRYYGGLPPPDAAYPAELSHLLRLAGSDGPLVLSLTAALGVALLASGALLATWLPAWAGHSEPAGHSELADDGELAGLTRALTQRVTRLTETRRDATETAVAELRRIERDLHDGAQARLVAVGMSLRAAERLMTANPEAALALMTEARETSSRALDDLRHLVRGIYPPVLADRGLSDAVLALALDCPLLVSTDIGLPAEPPMPVAAAAYFAIAEALTNAARHADAAAVDVTLAYADGMLRATVTDDGQGGADPALGTGLAGVERRLATFDGILAVSSPPGGPTIIALEIPYEPPAAGPAAAARGSLIEVVRSSWQTRTLI